MLYFDFINPYIIYLIVVLSFVGAIYAVFEKQNFIKKHKQTIFLIVTILLFWTQLARYVGAVLRDGLDLANQLPFFMCRLSAVVLLYYVITKDKRVESFLFYWGATGIAGVIYPNGPISNIPNLTETFYIDHFLLAITPFFLVIYQGYKPTKKDAYIMSGFMFVLLALFIPINTIFNTDFFYLIDQSIVGVFIPGLPSIVFALLHSLVALGFFLLYYKMFKRQITAVEVTS